MTSLTWKMILNLPTKMDLTQTQRDLVATLRVALGDSTGAEFVYHTEYLGFLPSGLYYWISVGENEVSRLNSLEWSCDDLGALEQAGLIAKFSKWVNPDDELETATIYRLQSQSVE